MATTVNIAERLLARPSAKLAQGRAEEKPTGNEAEFASVLQNVAQAKDAKDVKSTAAEGPRTLAKAAKSDKARGRDRNGHADEHDAADDETTVSQDLPEAAAEQADAGAESEEAAAAAETDETAAPEVAVAGDAAVDVSKLVIQPLPTPPESKPVTAPAAGPKSSPSPGAPVPAKMIAPDEQRKGDHAEGGREMRRGNADAKSAVKETPAVKKDEIPQPNRPENKEAEAVVTTPAPVKVARPAASGPLPRGDGEDAAKEPVQPQTNASLPATAPQAVPAAAETAMSVLPRATEMKDDAPRPAATPMVTPGGGEMRSELAAGSAGSAAQAQESPGAGSEKTFDQIVLGLRTKLDANNQKAQIELNPPNLGRLQVSVEVANGLLTAQFHATSDVVRELLSSNMDRLRSVLEGQGITVDKLAVSSGAAQERVASADSSGLANQNHDGRSGGAFAQERNASGRQGGETFGRIWRELRGQEEPIDLLA